MNLAKINSVTSLDAIKPTVSFHELPVETALPIVGARLITSTFGDSILLELSKNSMFLPTRYISVFRDHLQEFVQDAYSLIYLGRKTYKQHSTPIFKIVKNE